MLFNDPEKFETFLAPVGGDVLIRPATGTSFNAEINIKKLDQTGLFSIKADSFRVVKEAQEDFYGLTIPLSVPFSVSAYGNYQEYGSSSAHILTSGQSFDLKAKRKTHFLACCFFTKPIREYTQRLIQSDSLDFSLLKPDVKLARTGSHVLRSVARTWSAINSTIATNPITLKELEDDLLASFVMFSNEETNVRESLQVDNSYRLSRIEEYICENLNNPITRDQLAEVAGCSIRTLSRSFEKKHGIGPKAFIKQRRLDASYLDLLSAEPSTTTVTQVAINYGFSHVGKFAIEYGQAFGESPSVSLARR